MNRELLKADLQIIIDHRTEMLARDAIRQKENVRLYGVRSDSLNLAAILYQSEIDRTKLLINAVDSGRYDTKPDLSDMTKGM